ncbi:unnamed protein product [Parajaminaea phylloscopi]
MAPPASSAPGADPLASVITQVQPGQAASGSAALRPSAQGPARPTRVAKPGTAKAAAAAAAAAAASSSSTQQVDSEEKRKRKKKKKKQQQRSQQQGDQQQQEGGGSEAEAEAEAEAEGASTGADDPLAAGATAADPVSERATADPQAASGQVAPDFALAQSPGHGQDPSSTLIGTTSTAPDSSSGRVEDSTVAAGQTAASGTGLAATSQPVGSSTGESHAIGQGTQDQHSTEPRSSTLPSSSKAAAKPVSPQTTVGAPATQSKTFAPAAGQQGGRKASRSPLQKLIAFLTCSSGSAHDDGTEDAAAAASGARRQRGAEDIEMTPTRGGNSAVAQSQASKAGAKAGASRRDNARLAPPLTGAAALAAGSAAKGRGRVASRPSSARNSLEGRSESGIVAPAPGTPTPGGGTKLPREETGDVMSGAVVPPGSAFVSPHDAGGSPSRRRGAAHDPEASETGGDDDDEDDEDDDEEEETDDEIVEEYLDDDEQLSEEQRLIAQGGVGIPKDEFGNDCPLLLPLSAPDTGRKCLVLDLDETLVHSSFKMITNADFIVPVEIDGTVHNVYVIKRPGVDEFMRLMGEIYEVVVFTASLSKYADPVLDILDIHRVVRHRLFRESCYNHRGNYVKDLSQLGRPISESIIIDNSPASYIFHPNNAVPISSWFNDPHDTELTDLCPFLADLSDVADVRAVLDGSL